MEAPTIYIHVLLKINLALSIFDIFCAPLIATAGIFIDRARTGSGANGTMNFQTPDIKGAF